MEDYKNNFTTNKFAQQQVQSHIGCYWPAEPNQLTLLAFCRDIFVSIEQSIPELYDLVKKYEPEVIWSDGYSKAHDGK